MKYLLLFFAWLLPLSLTEESQLLKQFSIEYNNFTADIYKELLKSNPDNFIFSPLSVDVVITLINIGAIGQTSEQTTTILYLPENYDDIQKIFNSLSPYLQNDQYNLITANKMYIEEGYNFKDDYETVNDDVFTAEIQNINFTENIEAANEINQWIEDKTQKKIKNLIEPSILSEDTISVLLNTVYFHGRWVNSFNKDFISRIPFYIDGQTSNKTDIMFLNGCFEYYESSELNAKFLKLDYQGGDVSMNIVLPVDIEGWIDLEENILDVLEPPQYEIYSLTVGVPRFKIESDIQFKPILESLGIKDLSESNANLQEIVSRRNLTLSNVIQKAVIEIDEKATKTAEGTEGCGVSKFESFIADHPFLFYLRLNKMGINFLIGKYISP